MVNISRTENWKKKQKNPTEFTKDSHEGTIKFYSSYKVMNVKNIELYKGR